MIQSFGDHPFRILVPGDFFRQFQVKFLYNGQFHQEIQKFQIPMAVYMLIQILPQLVSDLFRPVRCQENPFSRPMELKIPQGNIEHTDHQSITIGKCHNPP